MAEKPEGTDLSGARVPDDYEAKYMAADGVYYRDKIKAPKLFFLIFAFPLAIQLVTFTALMLSAQPIPLAPLLVLPFSALMIAFLALLFAVLRITVTRSEVLIQYGLFGPKIALSAITSSKAVSYDWKQYGGWGIRRARDGSWAYNMMGDAGRAVRIEWTDPKGKKQVTLVASPNPDALARAINEARAQAGLKMRVAAEPSLEEFEAEAEADAETEAESALLEEELRKKN